jgi:hypothetical protein
VIGLRFPYRVYKVSGGRGGVEETIYRPTITVEVIGPKGSCFLDGRIDTGADETLLPWVVVDRVGARLEAGHAVRFETLTGEVLEAMRGAVDLRIEAGSTRVCWGANVLFVPSNPSPLFDIGGFLRHFAATFHGRQRWVELTPLPGLPRSRFAPTARV